MSNKSKAIIIVVACLVSFAVGRYTVPISVKEESKEVDINKQVEKKKEERDVHEHRDVITKKVTRPDGTIEIEKRIVEDKNTTDKKSSSDTSLVESDKESKKEVIRGGSKTNISVLFRSRDNVFKNHTFDVYGASINRELLGPITIGVFGFSTGSGGLSLGVNF